MFTDTRRIARKPTRRQLNRRSWFTIANLRPDGTQHILFDGDTTLDLAIGRARMYADATTGPLDVHVFRGKGVGRQLYRLTREN